MRKEALAIETSKLPLTDLFLALEHSPFASSLHEHNRFKQRFYFPQYGDTDEIWTKWVEPFTSLLEHQKDFAQWSITFHRLEKNRFSPEEQRLGILADAIHDLGEVKIEGKEFLGDIPSGIKTGADETKEAVIAHAAIDTIPLPKTLSYEILHRAYDQVVVGKNEKLYKAHKAREKWDYVRTGIHLYELTNSKKPFYSQHKIYALDWFITRILAYDLPKISSILANEYPKSIGFELIRCHDQLKGAFIRSQLFLDQLSAGTKKTQIIDDFHDLQQRLTTSYELWTEWVKRQ